MVNAWSLAASILNGTFDKDYPIMTDKKKQQPDPDGGIEEIISTRRLVHILRAYSIFNDKMKAIQVCVNRFDEETKQSFIELYDKVDADFNLESTEDKMYEGEE